METTPRFHIACSALCQPALSPIRGSGEGGVRDIADDEPEAAAEVLLPSAPTLEERDAVAQAPSVRAAMNVPSMLKRMVREEARWRLRIVSNVDLVMAI